MYFQHAPAIWRDFPDLSAGVVFTEGIEPAADVSGRLGAYTDIGCTVANCGHIWPREIIEYMRAQGAIGGAGMLEGHAEGIVRDVDVTKLPTG